jgi:hypothetical protein
MSLLFKINLNIHSCVEVAAELDFLCSRVEQQDVDALTVLKAVVLHIWLLVL